MFNINCQIAPLLDAVHEGCYKDMHKYMKKREEFFNKEIANLKKKEQGLLKRLEKIDPPKDEKALAAAKEESKEKSTKKKDAKPAATGAKDAKPKKKKDPKEEEEEKKRKEQEEADKKAKEEEERKKKEEEEAARKAEEEKKAKGAKAPPAKPGAKVEEKKEEEKVVETDEQKIAREKTEINAQIEEIKKQCDALAAKLKLLSEQQAKILEEEGKPKVIDLLEKTGERKSLKGAGDQYANSILRERKAYVLAKISKGAADEEVIDNIVIDGACIRTPEEDIRWEEEQKELEAQAANKKGGKGAPPPKKK